MPSPDLHEGLVFRCIGPFRGGRCVAVAGDPFDRNTFYMGTTGGGVWKSADGGAYWRNVSDGYFQRASVGAVAVAPSDANVIYVGMGETTIRGNVSHGDGVYRSTDAGSTWKHLGLKETRGIGKVRVHPQDSNTVLVAAFGHAHGPNPERGLYRSTNDGDDWELVLKVSDDAGANDVSIDPTNPRVIYVSFWEARRTPHSLTSGGPGCRLFRSVDGGTSWIDLSERPGMPKGLLGKIGIAVSPAKAGRIWAIVENENGGVFRSDDHGDSWARLNEDRNLLQRAWYYSHIYADPIDAETVWVLNVEMFRSIDGGKTFGPVPAPHGDNHDLWIDPQDPTRIILGNDGGATVSYTGGASWTSQYTQPTAEFYHVTTDTRVPYRVYGSQQDNSSMSVPSRSNHSAITVTEWYEIGGGEAGYISVRPDNPDIIYAGEYMGIMTRRDHASGHTRLISVWPEDNSGSSAEDYRYRFQWTYPILLSPHDPNVLMCAGNHVFRSIDEGSTWQQISPDLTRNDPSTLGPSGGEITKDNTGAEIYGTVFALAESPRTPGILWAGSDDGRIHVSRNNGETWTDVTPDLLPEWTLVSIIDPSIHADGTAYVAANRYKLDDFRPYVLKTTDFGESWTRISSNLPKHEFVRVVREDHEVSGLLICGTEAGLYVSYDDGLRWHNMRGNFPTVPVHDLQIRADDLVVGTHGRSFWILDDVSLLRQIARSSSATTAPRLFAPRPAMRFESIGSFGHTPIPGQNYDFVSVVVPSFDLLDDDAGGKRKNYLDAGENPPDGTIIWYSLPSVTTDIRLSIQHHDGNEIVAFVPKPPVETKAEPPSDEAHENEPEGPFLPAKAGLNRFIWDLRMAKATKISTKGGDQPDRTGPRLLPGIYSVVLKSGDWSATEQFEVLPDPRGHGVAADLEAQVSLHTQIHAKHDQLNRTVNAIRKTRDEVSIWQQRAKAAGNDAILEKAKAVSDRLDTIEEVLLQRKIQSEQDSLNYPIRLNSKLAMLGNEVGSGTHAPTGAMVELYDQLAVQVDEQIAAFNSLMSADISKLNAAISTSDITPISLTTETT
ncbi:hypothetical protein BH23CHL5_BH23CHL5_09940 [soil metagenome]